MGVALYGHRDHGADGFAEAAAASMPSSPPPPSSSSQKQPPSSEPSNTEEPLSQFMVTQATFRSPDFRDRAGSIRRDADDNDDDVDESESESDGEEGEHGDGRSNPA